MKKGPCPIGIRTADHIARLVAEMLWDHHRDLGDMLYEVAHNPAVDFT